MFVIARNLRTDDWSEDETLFQRCIEMIKASPTAASKEVQPWLQRTGLTEQGFPGGSEVKKLPVMQETQVQSLGQKNPLEKGMATLSNILAWIIYGQRSLVGYSPM